MQMLNSSANYMFKFENYDYIIQNAYNEIIEVDLKVKSLKQWLDFMGDKEFKRVKLNGMETTLILTWELFMNVINSETTEQMFITETIAKYKEMLLEVEENIKSQL